MLFRKPKNVNNFNLVFNLFCLRHSKNLKDCWGKCLKGDFYVNFVIKVEKRYQCSRLLYIFIVYCYWSFLWFSLCFSAFNSIEVVLYWRNKYINFILQHIYGIVKVNIMNCWIKNAVFGDQLKKFLKFSLLMLYWEHIFHFSFMVSYLSQGLSTQRKMLRSIFKGVRNWI